MIVEAVVVGGILAAALVGGAVAAVAIEIPRRAVALLLAFGAGTLISALAVELSREAFEAGGTLVFAGGLGMGALVYFAGNRAIHAVGGRRHRARRMGDGDRERGNGPAIVLGTLLDGVPESLVLGSTLLTSGGTLPLLAALVASNVPEAIAGSADLRAEGRSRAWVLATWIGVGVVLAAATALGVAALGEMSEVAVAAIEAFAAGAIIAMLVETMIPEAYRDGGDLVGLATALGFATAFLLSSVMG